MRIINKDGKKILQAKLVYYGTALGGKTTNLEQIYNNLPSDRKSKSIAEVPTSGDKTLAYEFFPAEFGSINGFTVQTQLYTVPGQVHYNHTRRNIWKGTDAVVFVADSQTEKQSDNIAAYQEMYLYLEENNISALPAVIFNSNAMNDGGQIAPYLTALPG